MPKRFTLTEKDLFYSAGVCLSCGHVQDGCEPDACKYECEECGVRNVYGVPEAIIMDAVTIDPEVPESALYELL